MKARLPKGYGHQSQAQMMKKIQKMQEDMAATQAALEETEYQASTGGGAVTVVMNGKREITGLTLAPEVVDPEDIEMLQDLVIAAVNEVLQKVENDASEKMGVITGGINLLGGISL